MWFASGEQTHIPWDSKRRECVMEMRIFESQSSVMCKMVEMNSEETGNDFMNEFN